MTQKKILFVSGAKSIFFHQPYWGKIPQYLKQHGYEVESIDLGWGGFETRRDRLIAYLTPSTEAFHIISDCAYGVDGEFCAPAVPVSSPVLAFSVFFHGLIAKNPMYLKTKWGISSLYADTDKMCKKYLEHVIRIAETEIAQNRPGETASWINSKNQNLKSEFATFLNF